MWPNHIRVGLYETITLLLLLLLLLLILILDRIQRRQLKWYGHLLRMELTEYLSVNTIRQEEKRKTATIMKEPSDGFHEKKKHRRYGRR